MNDRQRDTQSPYSGWYTPQKLQEEADRIRALPEGSVEVQRWRRKQVRLIEARIRDLYRTRDGT